MARLASSKVIDQIVANLVAGGTQAGSRIFASRFWPLSEGELPAIRVFAEDEIIEPRGISLPIRLEHELIVAIDCYVRAVDDADDAMHTIAFEAWLALFETDELATLSPLDAVAMRPIGISRGVGENEEAAMARITVRLSVQFHTNSSEPENLAG